MTNKTLILSNKAHPLYEKLSKLGLPFLSIDGNDTFEPKSYNNEFSAVFDFTNIEKLKKHALLKRLSIECQCPVYSDLTFYWVQEFFNFHNNLAGAFSTIFYSPNNKFEFTLKPTSDRTHIDDFFKSLEMQGVDIGETEYGFIFPRTLSMIINEAFYVMKEKVADEASIDVAMQFGVNYPLGVVDWAKKTGLKNVVTMLDELHSFSGEERYKVNSLLRSQALIN